MHHDRDHELLTRFHVLHEAVARQDALEEQLRSALPPDEDLLDRSLAAAEAVLAARASLYRHLISTGWTPPPPLARDLAYDEIVLSEPDGAVHG